MDNGHTRGLTTQELRRFGSFPRGYRFDGTAGNAHERIGNSVPPNFMRAIAEHIYDTILQPTSPTVALSTKPG